MVSANFVDLGLPLFQSGRGDVFIEEFLVPVLSSSSRYDRLTGYFSVHSFAAIAQGLENLIQNNGTIRVVIGLHDVSEEILKACEEARDWPVAIINSLTEDFKSEVGRIRDGIVKNRLQTISWMIAAGIMQVKVAAPKNRLQFETERGIFHSKRMIFEDCEHNLLVGIGSQNETWASQNNIEDILFTASWLDPGTAVSIQNDFENLWTGKRSDVYIVDVTTELTKILSLLAIHPGAGKLPHPNILDFARNSPAFGPFNLTQATLYPHQERVYIDALSRWPVRVMLSDEVGLGKTP